MSTPMSSSGRESSGKEKVGKKLEVSVGERLDFPDSKIAGGSSKVCPIGLILSSSYLLVSRGPIRSRQESKVVESGSCGSSSRFTSGVIVNNGALEHTVEDSAKDDTEKEEDNLVEVLVDSEERFVSGVRKQFGSGFS